jgi:DNA (cytosine-5)-methyltransferase 1
LPAFPIWSDVRSFDGKPWRGIVDVVRTYSAHW